jgi:NAD dependent epimerase/dehydratase family enzyme
MNFLDEGKVTSSLIRARRVVSAVEFLIDREDLHGVVNLAAPNPLPNRDFMRDLRKAWGIRIGIPPANWMLKIGASLLRTETELVHKSRRVIPGRLLKAGFQFQFSEWSVAARDLVARWRRALAEN